MQLQLKDKTSTRLQLKSESNSDPTECEFKLKATILPSRGKNNHGSLGRYSRSLTCEIQSLKYYAAITQAKRKNTSLETSPFAFRQATCHQNILPQSPAIHQPHQPSSTRPTATEPKALTRKSTDPQS